VRFQVEFDAKRTTACNGTIVTDSEMGEVIQLQGDQRKDVQEFLVAKDGLELDAKTIKVNSTSRNPICARLTVKRSTVSKRFNRYPVLSCSVIKDR